MLSCDDNYYPDLLVDKCPLGCDNCAQVYVNNEIGHRIICKCLNCNHGNLKNKKIKEHQQEVEKEDQFPNQPHVEANIPLAPIGPGTEDKN